VLYTPFFYTFFSSLYLFYLSKPSRSGQVPTSSLQHWINSCHYLHILHHQARDLLGVMTCQFILL
jgi:hypothetical protein